MLETVPCRRPGVGDIGRAGPGVGEVGRAGPGDIVQWPGEEGIDNPGVGAVGMRPGAGAVGKRPGEGEVPEGAGRMSGAVVHQQQQELVLPVTSSSII